MPVTKPAARPDEPAPTQPSADPAEGLTDDPVDDPALADIAELGYEQARDELVAIVARLEGGQTPLEQCLTLWRRGEALAAHCSQWLDAAQAQIGAAADG